MKKITKLASALMLSAALMLGAAGTAFAATVTFEGPNAGSAFSIADGTEYHETDLFEGLKNVMPGDELTQQVTVANDHKEAVKVYLKAEAHDEEGNPLQYSEPFEAADGKDQGKDPEKGDNLGGPGERDETVATMADFLAQLDMRVYNGGKLVFEGSPDVEGGLAGGVLLGEIAPGKELALTVELDVPEALGNEYAYRVGEVDWVFTAEVEDPKLPTTGDSMPIMLLAAVTILAAAIVILAALMRRYGRR